MNKIDSNVGIMEIVLVDGDLQLIKLVLFVAEVVEIMI